MNVEYKQRLRDYIRGLIGDVDAEDLLTDAKLDSLIEGRVIYSSPQTERLICYNNKFRSSYARPVHELTILTPASEDHTYRIDESNKMIEYIAGGTAPSDRDELTIKYVDVDFNMLMGEIFEYLASAHRKMASTQDVGGMSIDATKLADEFQKQSNYWSCKDQW